MSPDHERQAKGRRGWIAIAAPLAAVLTATGAILGPFVTGWFNLESAHSKGAMPIADTSQSTIIDARAPTMTIGTFAAITPPHQPALPHTPSASISTTKLQAPRPTPTRTAPSPPPAPSSPASPMPIFAIIIHDAPSIDGVYPAPFSLTWSPVVTLNGRIVTGDCSVYWTLYLGTSIFYQAPADSCNSTFVSDLTLNAVGNYRLVGKISIDSMPSVTESVTIPVGP